MDYKAIALDLFLHGKNSQYAKEYGLDVNVDKPTAPYLWQGETQDTYNQDIAVDIGDMLPPQEVTVGLYRLQKSKPNVSQINPEIPSNFAKGIMAFSNNAVCLDLATTGLTASDEVMVASLYDVATGETAQFKCRHMKPIHIDAARYSGLADQFDEPHSLNEIALFWALLEGKQVVVFNAEFAALMLGTALFMRRSPQSIAYAPEFMLVGIADMVAQWFYYARQTPPDLQRKSVKFLDVVGAMQWSLPYAKSDPYGHLLAKPALLWRMVQQVGAFDAEYPLKDATNLEASNE